LSCHFVPLGLFVFVQFNNDPIAILQDCDGSSTVIGRYGDVFGKMMFRVDPEVHRKASLAAELTR